MPNYLDLNGLGKFKEKCDATYARIEDVPTPSGNSKWILLTEYWESQPDSGINISSYIENYEELMILVAIDIDSPSIIGIANTNTGSNSFLCSLTLGNNSSYGRMKFTMTKTSDFVYMWDAMSSASNIQSDGQLLEVATCSEWTTATNYIYFRCYTSSDASIDLYFKVYGR